MRVAVSIIIPIYNMEKYLLEAINSVVEQSFDDIEIICVNDGSTDKSLSIIKECSLKDKRITIIDKKNGGYGQAVNDGIRAAHGEYIGIVEPDDYINIDMVASLYSKAKQYNLDIISADYTVFFGEDNERVYRRKKVFSTEEYYDRVISPQKVPDILLGKFINPAGLFRRRMIIDRSSYHNETPGASFQDMGFFFLTMMQADRVMISNAYYYNYRKDNPMSSTKGDNDIEKVLNEYTLIFDRVLHLNIQFELFKTFLQKRFFESLRLVLSRTSIEHKRNVIFKISKVLNDMETNIGINCDCFEDSIRNELKMIMDSPDEYYKSYISLADEIGKAVDECESFIIFGAGVVGCRIFEQLDEIHLSKFKGFVVSNTKENNKRIGDYCITDVDTYAGNLDKTLVIVGVSPLYQQQVIQLLGEKGIEHIFIPNSVAINS